MKLKIVSSFWINSIFFTLLNRLSLLFFSIVTVMLLTKKAFPTASEMGVWALFTMITSLIEMTKQGLLRNPMIKYLSEPEYANQKNKVQSSSLITNLIFTLLVILLIVFGGKAFSGMVHAPELAPLLNWNILYIIILIPFNHYEVVLQAHFKFHAIFWGYFFRQGLFFVGIVIMLLFFKPYLSLISLVRLQVLSVLIGTIFLYYPARKYFFKGFDFDKTLMIRMLHFGKYIFGTNVFSQLSRYMDQLITASILTTNTLYYVGYYGVASKVNSMLDVPSVAIADVLFPKNVEAMATDGLTKVKYYFERMVGTIVAVLLPVSLGIFLLPRLVIWIIAGSKYYAAIPILQTVILTSVFRPFFYQFGTTMDAINKPNVNFWVNLGLMIFNPVSIAIGLKYFGYMGAAYGTVVCNVTSVIVVMIVLKKYVDIRVKNIAFYVIEAYKEIFNIAKSFFARKAQA